MFWRLETEEHQKNSKSLKCIAILVVTIVVLVFVIIRKVTVDLENLEEEIGGGVLILYLILLLS